MNPRTTKRASNEPRGARAPRGQARGDRRAGLYVRISKDRAREVSTSIQTKAATTYCAGKGWPIVGTYTDRGRSAYKRGGKRADGSLGGVRRDALERLMADVEAGIVNVVVVYRLDRVSRSVGDFAALWGRLEVAGCEFVSVNEQFDTSSAMGRAMLQIATVFAELESAIKSERITDMHEAKRAAGAAPTGPRPFGYRPDRSIVAKEAKLIRSAAAKVIDGESLRGIVADWNRRGIVNSAGRPWSSRGLRFVLTSPHTAGMRDVDGLLVSGSWKGVLDRRTHGKLVSVMNDPARRTTTGNGRVHLLTGIARCGLCGTPLAVKPHLSGSRYLCAPRKGHEACERLSIQATGTDAAVIEMVLARIEASRDAIGTAMKGQKVDPSTMVDKLEVELEQLAADYGRGDLSRLEWQAARAGLEQRLGDAHRDAFRVAGSGMLRKLRAGDLTKTFAKMTLEEQRLVLLAVLDCVEIRPADPRGNLVDRVAPVWRV